MPRTTETNVNKSEGEKSELASYDSLCAQQT